MTMISENWAELQIPVIYNFFDIGRNLRPSLIPQLYSIRQSLLAEEKHVGIGGINDAAWDDYESAGVIGKADFNKGYVKTFTHAEYPLDIPVKRKLLDDDQYGVIADTARRIGISVAQRQERHAAQVFNKAFTTGVYVGSDGVALCSDSHPTSTSNGAVQDNNYALTLTAANIETMRIDMMNFLDDQGNKLGLMPDTLIVPLALEDTARKQVGSVLDPATANNTMNPQSGRWNIIAWNQLTDSNAWFMVDSVWMKESLLWYERVAPEITFKTMNQVEVMWSAYMRYSFGFTDWRWVAGSNPS